MCTNPQHIIVRSSKSAHVSRLRWIPALQTDSVYRKILPTAFRAVDVPCGKCIECLRRRQNDLAARCAREASLRGSMIFVTLTYREDMCPYACTLVRMSKTVDIDTGEILSDTVFHASPLEREAPMLSAVRSAILAMPKGHISRKLHVPLSEVSALDSEYNYEYVFSQSLRREDVRLWLKLSRVRYEREFGCKLPSFSYVIVGEYGPKTCRPHYHVAFFGLSLKDVNFLTSIWIEKYGEVNTKVVNCVNSDGTSGFVFAARYIGKYMTKGRFECDSVTCGYAEKPRLCASRGLGYDGTFEHKSSLSERFLAYYRCYDLVGRYDLETCRKTDGTFLTSSDITLIANEFRKRSSLTICCSKFPMPSCFKKKIWYVQDFQKQIYSSPVRQLLTAVISDNVPSNAQSASLQGCEFDGVSSSSVREFIDCENFLAKTSDAFAERAAAAWYRKSIF